jgi:hypothetical protein
MQAHAGLDIGHTMDEGGLCFSCHDALTAACKVPANIWVNTLQTANNSAIATYWQRSGA